MLFWQRIDGKQRPYTHPGNVPLTVTDETVSYDGVVAWQWDFGDRLTSKEPSPTHVYLWSGAYNVSLIVWEQNGGWDSETKIRYVVIPEGPCLLLAILLVAVVQCRRGESR